MAMTKEEQRLKPCRRCGEVDRYESGACRACHLLKQRDPASKEKNAAWYQRNKEKLAAKRAQNPDRKARAAANQVAWRKRNPEKAAEYRLKYPEKQRAYLAATREKRVIRLKENYQRNKHKQAAQHREKNYGVSPARQAELLLLQGGCCPICLVRRTEAKKDFSVDHDHSCCPGDYSCGKCVRGLLCRYCNVGIGNLRDNLDNLQRAIAYLRNPTTNLRGAKTMNPTGNLFAGLKSAKTYERGTWLKEGQYVVRAKRAIWKTTRSKGDAFILEVAVERSTYEADKKKAIAAFGTTPFSMQDLEKLLPNQIGTTASWYQSMKDMDVGFGAIKSFAAAILGQKPDDPEFIEQVEGFMNAVVNGAPDDPTHTGVINGMLIPVEVVVVQTKAEKDFSLHRWGQIIDEQAAAAG